MVPGSEAGRAVAGMAGALWQGLPLWMGQRGGGLLDLPRAHPEQ